MLKDIPHYKVTQLGLAIAPREDDPADPAQNVTDYDENGEPITLWDAYLINLRDRAIRNVIVNMRGYGQPENATDAPPPEQTSNLRVFIEQVPPQSYVRVEAVPTNIHHLTQQYWVSFTEDGRRLYDKKFVFVKGSLDEMHFTQLPLINKPGVIIM